jgi:DNA-binding NarL/FixJ family response regulator
MSTKRVILANRSRLLREMLRRVIDRADNLQVVQEVSDQDHLSAAIEQSDPEWVIMSVRAGEDAHSRMQAWLVQYPVMRFVVLSADNSTIRIKSRASEEVDLTNLSLADFLHVLEKDLQHT